MEFGEKIKALRTARGITQKQFGAYLGVSDSIISDYEHGRKNPSHDTLVKIAVIFGVSMDDLYGIHDGAQDLTTPFVDLSGLTERQISLIYGLADEFRRCNEEPAEASDESE